jgi:hypothetical protein
LFALLAVYIVNFVIDLCGLGNAVRIPITAVTAMMAVVPITLFLLRLVVYFRDSYRATTYGVPDLVDIVRLIDASLDAKQPALAKEKDQKALENWVELSFIGHSMGGFVVTNAVRILTDVFSPVAKPKTIASIVGDLDMDSHREERSHIGKALKLQRLVLVSPDIPAEALLSGRANFLHSSLDRFDEAHLFSNESDEVLLNISTTANFFALPTNSREFGYRLGNVGVLSDWGITAQLSIEKLRLGSQTVAKLYKKLDSLQYQTGLAQRFSYFDCTDAIENGHGVVTDVKPGQPADLSWFAHMKLLASYALWGSPDVHSGYFKPGFVAELLYRLACIGYRKTETAYGHFDAFNCVIQGHQVKALRSSAQRVSDESTSRDQRHAG